MTSRHLPTLDRRPCHSSCRRCIPLGSRSRCLVRQKKIHVKGTEGLSSWLSDALSSEHPSVRQAIHSRPSISHQIDSLHDYHASTGWAPVVLKKKKTIEIEAQAAGSVSGLAAHTYATGEAAEWYRAARGYENERRAKRAVKARQSQQRTMGRLWAAMTRVARAYVWLGGESDTKHFTLRAGHARGSLYSEGAEEMGGGKVRLCG